MSNLKDSPNERRSTRFSFWKFFLSMMAGCCTLIFAVAPSASSPGGGRRRGQGFWFDFGPDDEVDGF